MKTVFLIRHAKSSWDDVHLQDHDRPLAKRGLEDAPNMAKHLTHRNISPDIAISSSASRTKQTYAFFAPYFKGLPLQIANNLYMATAENILEHLRHLSNDLNTVLLFGHNPGFEDLVNKISSEYIKIPTCSITELNFEDTEWIKINEAQCSIRSFMTPKLLAD